MRDLLMSVPYDSVRQWRRELAAGRRVGPRVVAGGYITAPQPPGTTLFGSTQWTGAGTPEQGRRAVDSLAKVGFDLIKLHDNGTAPDVYFAIAAEARKIGIPFAGHSPSKRVSAEAIADSGQKSLEHIGLSLLGFGSFTEGPCARLGAEADRACAALAAHHVQRGTWITPTLFSDVGPEQVRGLRPGWYASFVPDTANLLTPAGKMWFMSRLARAGFPMLAGTDQVGGVYPYGRERALPIHAELAMMVQAGMTPLAALQTATLNPAQYLGATDSLGTVEAGKLADLVLLDADPLADIRHTTAIAGVVANGRYFDRAALDDLFAKARARNSEQPS